MSTKIVLQAAAAATLLYAGVSSAQAAPFTNGSFEDGTFTPVSDDTVRLSVADTTMPGWTVSGTHEIAWIGGSNPFGLMASNGDKFLDLTSYGFGAGGGVEQTFDTIAGKTYNVTFDIGGATGTQIVATAHGSGGTFSATGGLTSWTPQLLTFTAIGSSTLLSFLGAAESGSDYIGLDNVQVAVAATPLPGSVLMFGTGLLGLGFVGYRRSKKAGSAALSAI